MKFSIIIPCYNAEKWISHSIESALGQTYENIEVIVIDNESTDNSFSVISDQQKKHPSLEIGTAPNLYPYAWTEPVDEALSRASGDYFTILGADDLLDSDYIKRVEEIISTAPDKIKLLQTPIRSISATGETLGKDLDHSYRSLQEFKEALFIKCPVTTPSVVYSRDLYDEGIVRWDSETWVGAADYDLYFNLADQAHFIYPYPKWVGYYYRWHQEQSTWGMQKDFSKIDNKIREHWRKRWFGEQEN